LEERGRRSILEFKILMPKKQKKLIIKTIQKLSLPLIIQGKFNNKIAYGNAYDLCQF